MHVTPGGCPRPFFLQFSTRLAGSLESTALAAFSLLSSFFSPVFAHVFILIVFFCCLLHLAALPFPFSIPSRLFMSRSNHPRDDLEAESSSSAAKRPRHFHQGPDGSESAPAPAAVISVNTPRGPQLYQHALESVFGFLSLARALT